MTITIFALAIRVVRRMARASMHRWKDAVYWIVNAMIQKFAHAINALSIVITVYTNQWRIVAYQIMIAMMETSAPPIHAIRRLECVQTRTLFASATICVPPTLATRRVALVFS